MGAGKDPSCRGRAVSKCQLPLPKKTKGWRRNAAPSFTPRYQLTLAHALESSPMKLVRIFTLVALTVALLAGCGGNKDSDGTPRTSDGDRETSAPVKSAHAEDGQDYSAVNPDTLTSDQFFDDLIYPEKYRVSWASKTLDQKTTPEVVSQMNALLASDGRDQLGTIVPASPDNTGNEILARQSLATYIASTEPDPERGRKLLAAVVSPKNPGFTDLMAQLGHVRTVARDTDIYRNYRSELHTQQHPLKADDHL